MCASKCRKALIVGAGFGGIATSLRLRRLGYEVTVVDNNPQAGGRAQVYEMNDTNLMLVLQYAAPFLLMNYLICMVRIALNT